jgi:hypothetical protein
MTSSIPRHHLPPNFPTKPTPTAPKLLSFPRDIIADDRNFYMQIDFVKYNSLAMNYMLGNTSKFPNPTGGVILPLPKRINDQQTVTWEPASATTMAASLSSNLSKTFNAITRIAGPVGGALGIAQNPCLWMLFKNPEFKSFNLTWTFAANNEQETKDIAEIINIIKLNQLPINEGLAYQYPSIAMIKMYPANMFTVKFRPCAVIQVDVDYTGSGGPSFFKNGAPTVVNLHMHIREIELWAQNNYDNGSYY